MTVSQKIIVVVSAILSLQLHGIAALPPTWDQVDESYSFETYVKDFGKKYESEDEFQRRKNIFETNLVHVIQHNQKRTTEHVLGVNRFMDYEPHEMPLGLDKANHQRHIRDALSEQRVLEGSYSMELPFEMEDVSELPAEVDWRKSGVVTPIKDQGDCGSCWAFASSAVLESHIALKTGVLYTFSAQELISCALNPEDCGGEGGCLGSTAELSFDFVWSLGIVEEWQFGYGAYHGEKVDCLLSDGHLRDIKNAVATIRGFSVTHLNDYKAVMNAVAQVGPIAINVAADGWGLYEGGVFHQQSTKPSSYDINHVVVLDGYGTDEKTGEDYWLVRNSWGPRWGEKGYIRLKRQDPNEMENPDDDCGMDISPFDGDECAYDGNDNPVPPTPIKVCGTSGAYYHAVMPFGGYLL